MAKNKTEAIITLNGQQPLQVLKQLQEAAAGISDQIDAAQAKLKTLKPNTDPYKALVATINDLKKQYDLLASAQIKDIAANERLQSVVDQLSNTSLRNLRRALGDGKRQLEGLSEAELEQANAIRAMMKTVGDQIRLLEGKYVKIREGLASIGTQSDQWLSKAIEQQKDLMDYTRRGTKEYKEQEQVMQMLTAEQNKRNAAISAEATAKRQAQFKQQVASSRQMLSSTDTMKNHSQTEIQTAINTLKQAQGQSNIGGSEWKQYADEIVKAEERLAALAGKVKEVKQVMSEKDAKDTITFMDSHTEGEVREAINTLRLLQSQTHIGSEEWKKYAISIADAEESLAKLTGKVKEVKEELSLTEVNDRMKTLGEQSEQSLQDMLRVLQEAKGSMQPFSKEWEDLAAKIDSVKTRMADVASNSPFERNYDIAQKMARQDGLLDKEGYLRSPTKNDLEWSKSYLQKELGNTSPLETIKIAEIKEALGMLDERLSVFKDNADKSAMSAEKLNEVLSNMKTASLDDLKAASAELNKQLGKLAPSSDAAKQVKQQLQALDKEIRQVEDDVVDVNDVIARSKKGKASIEELKKAYQQLQAELNKINTGDEEFKNKQKALKDLKKEIDDVTGAAKKQDGAWQTVLKNLTAYVGMFAVFNQAKTLLTGVIQKNLDMSDSLANIRKVSGLLHQDIDKMAVSLSKIDTRTSVQELQNIAYAGAKLGIGEYGPEGLESFVKAANQVNVALKEDLGDEALSALSKITEVMGLIPKMGVEQSMLKTGSAIFKLASTSTATSGKIIDFSNRLLAMGKVGALSTSDILALGAAVDSMAIEPEVASTAFAKLITEIRKGTSSIEHDLGLAKGTLSEFLKEGRGIEALQTIFHKMRESGNVFALDSLFKDLGSDGSRLIKVMVTMAEKADMLDKAVATSRKAFDEGMAVTQEYNIQQDTAKGILERANNMWNKAFANPDGINSVKQLTIAWYDLSRALTTSTASQKAVLGTIDLLVLSCKTLIALLPSLVGFFIGKGIAMAAVQLVNISKAVWAWVIAQKALNLAMASNVFGLALGVLSTLYAYFLKNANAAEDAANAADHFTKSLSGAKLEVGRATLELDGYKRAIDGAKKGTKERQAAIDQFNNKFGSYLSKLITEKSTVNDLKKAYNEAANAIERKVMAQAAEKDIQQHVAPKAGREAQLLYNYDQQAKKTKLGQYGSSWLKAFVDDNLEKHGLDYTINAVIQRSGIGKGYDSRHSKGLITSVKNTNGAPATGYNWTSSSRGIYGEKHINHNSGKYSDRERMAAMAVAYIRQRGARVKSQQEVEKKYKDFPGIFVTEIPGGVDTGGGGGDSGNKGGGGKNTPKIDDTAKTEEQKAKTRANALIANIKAFYEEQKRKYLEWVAQMNADGEKVSEGQQQQMLAMLDAKTKTALGAARKSIATMSDDFKNFFSNMDKDVLINNDETSKELLESIGKSDISELHALFQKLSGDLSRENNQTLSENLGALLDQIFANGSKELREAAEKLLAQQREIQKILNEHDYTGAVDRSTRSNFDKIGFLRPASGVDAATEEGLQKMNDAFDNLTAKARSAIVELYQLNPESEDFQNKFLGFLSVANNGFDFTKLTAQQLKALYVELIKYNDEYDAASKKRDDERKKLNDYSWSQTAVDKEYQQRLPGMQQEVAVTGNYRNAAQSMGMQSISATDPELEMMKMRMEYAETYYAFLEEHQATEQQLADARKNIMSEQASYAQKLTSDMFSQYNSLLTFMGPLQTFGESVGDAFATMTENVSEGRKALRTALKQMVKQFAVSTLQMISQQQIDRAQTTAHYTELLMMQQAFGTAKVSAEIATGTAIIGAQQATHLSEEELEGVHQQVMASLRSAGIFGWCVSTLGPIAGPIAYSAMMAILMGLLNIAIGKIGSGGKSANTATTNTKLVTGMLTYDSGNVQDLKPFVADNGEVYWAKEDDGKQMQGVKMLTTPTATFVNGQPSLVAERGPEIVIGRETTHAMMMNNPGLLKALVNYDSNYSGRNSARRAFDNGNVGDVLAAGTQAGNGNLPSGASAADGLIAASAASNAALLQAVNALIQRLNQPINAKINMYGRDGLHDSLNKANQFMKGK